MTTLTKAHHQWANRAPDEQFCSVDERTALDRAGAKVMEMAW